MKTQLKKLMVVAVMVCGALLAGSAQAILIGADQLLGTVVPGVPANPANEMEMINGLLRGWDEGLVHVDGYNDGAAAGTMMGDNPNDPNAELYTLLYNANLPAPALPLAVGEGLNTDTGNPGFTLDGSTYEWAVAKWGNSSAVYYIAGLTGEVTLTRDGTGWGDQGYGLSGYTLFNSHQVPDGGTTAALMGLGILGLGVLRRRMKA